VHLNLFMSFLILICTKESVDSNQFTYENAWSSSLEDIVGDNSVIEWCLNNFLVVDDSDPSTRKESSEIHLIDSPSHPHIRTPKHIRKQRGSSQQTLCISNTLKPTLFSVIMNSYI